jgi:hypothetical protein
MSQGHRQTTEKTDDCVRLWRSLEPEGFVPPALVRADSIKNQQDLAAKSSRGALPVLVASLTATIAYFITAGSVRGAVGIMSGIISENLMIAYYAERSNC